jgi:myo-inositol-1(or 4)-monophosphatase
LIIKVFSFIFLYFVSCIINISDMMMDLKELTLAICDISRRVGAYQREQRELLTLDKVESKHSHDYVSYVDKHSEEQLVAALKALPVDAGFITEEKTASYNNEQYCWIIDPLDGTTNFIHHYAPSAISIALRKDDEILLGVIYEICADECFYAWKGGGAYLNDSMLSVNKANDIDRALLCLELPYNVDSYSDMAHHLIKTFYGRVGGIRMNGSAATALAYVAAGRLDGWIERYIGAWDISAGIIIIREAGGNVTSFLGDEQCLDNDNIVASNGTIHSDLLAAINY